MDLSKLDINSIAQNIDMGMHCHIHKETLEVITLPDPDELFDPEHWEEDIEKVSENFSDYVSIKKMDSTLSFQVMEDFTKTVKNKALRSRLQSALDNRKPFRNWNNIIHDTGDERQDWFDFKQARMEIWVACHLEKDDQIFAEKAYIRRTIVHEPAFTGISRVVYRVDDIDGAIDWYTDALNMHPTSQTDKEAIFKMDNQELILQERDDDDINTTSSVLVYWRTDSIETVLSRLNKTVGVDYIQDIESIGDGNQTAIIEDLWGNEIGLISHS